MADDQHDDQHDDEVRKNAPNYYSHGKALAAARAHRAAVVESSPEVAALRARVAELEAAAKPKARDESVPPPGWILWWKDGDEQTPENIERADRAMRDGPLVTAIPIAQAWRFYDREHGYTPDEARIRADERAKLSKALHRMAVEETESDARSAGLHEAAMFVESDGASHGEPAACTHPKDRRIATYDEPGAFTCVACGLSVSTLSPAPEPAVPDPWPLPAGLEWGHDGYEPNGWHITDRRRRWAVWIHEDGSVVGTLPRCNDATLIDLIRLRNAAEPTGPKK